MVEASTLLGQIADFRRRLEAMPPLGGPGDAASGLERVVRSLTGEADAEPRHLTARARRLLHEARELITRWRESDDTAAATAEAALRLVRTFPEAPSAQARLCGGVEAILDAARQRADAVTAAADRDRAESRSVDELAELLTGMEAGRGVDVPALRGAAGAVLADAGGPMRFAAAPADDVARFAAAHGLTTARVVARMGGDADAVVAALIHDVGMLRVPAGALSEPEKLSPMRRRVVEQHARIGAELVAEHMAGDAELAAAVGQHHERLDGTGYPDGLAGGQVGRLARALAAADVYAALASPRPHRPALDTRTALADTMMLADAGKLDRPAALRLFGLSMYPVGSAVALSDGSAGVVVAGPRGGDADRPVVHILADADGGPPPLPRHVDLSAGGDLRVARTLPAEARAALGRRHPELAG